MELSKKDLEKQAVIRKDIEDNFAFYIKKAMTADQIKALNSAKRTFYKNNQSIRNIEENKDVFAYC